uniref:Uncharacterized protein n=1 Tax=Corvus moneduloides TaxID=1196302 RepID=A0A8U7N7C5_CORMO
DFQGCLQPGVFQACLQPGASGDTCEYLMSSGRFLGEKVWQPHSCMMHKYKNSEAKKIALIRQLFYSFIKLINPQVKEEGKQAVRIKQYPLKKIEKELAQ